MKICQTVRRWGLVTGGRTTNVVSTQCFICLRHKGPVKNESFLAIICCGCALRTLQQQSNLTANATLQTALQRLTERSRVKAQICFMAV